jgi:hypothetical protein
LDGGVAGRINAQTRRTAKALLPHWSGRLRKDRSRSRSGRTPSVWSTGRLTRASPVRSTRVSLGARDAWTSSIAGVSRVASGTPALTRGCRTNQSENRAVNWSRANSGLIGPDRRLQWDETVNESVIRPYSPTGARAVVFHPFPRQPHAKALALDRSHGCLLSSAQARLGCALLEGSMCGSNRVVSPLLTT